MFKREIKKKSIILPPNKYCHFGDSRPGFSHMCTLKKKKNLQAVVYVLLSRGVCLVAKTRVASKTNVSCLAALPGTHLASDGNLEI